MQNYLLIKKSRELEDFSQELGFEKTLFLGEDFVIINKNTKKEVLKEIEAAKKKKLFAIYKAPTEEMLRFVLERTSVDAVMSLEDIHPKESLHYTRGGLDQIFCRIAAEREKAYVVSFNEILNTANKARLLRRIMFNIRLCRKYKVKVIFGTFAASKMELRSRKDLEAFGRILGL